MIFKYVNSAVGLNFNKNFTEKKLAGPINNTWNSQNKS